VTSADSGALVIDTLASGGQEDTPRWQRVYWCLLLAVTSTLLLLTGGLGALQAATLLAALPFCFIMLLLAFGLLRQTKADLAGVTLSNDAAALGERLKRLVVPSTRADIEAEIERNGLPALRSVCEVMQAEGWTDSRVDSTEDGLTLVVGAGGAISFTYKLIPRSRALAAYTAREARVTGRSQTWALTAQSGTETGYRNLTGFSQDQISTDVVRQLERWRLG